MAMAQGVSILACHTATFVTRPSHPRYPSGPLANAQTFALHPSSLDSQDLCYFTSGTTDQFDFRLLPIFLGRDQEMTGCKFQPPGWEPNMWPFTQTWNSWKLNHFVICWSCLLFFLDAQGHLVRLVEQVRAVTKGWFLPRQAWERALCSCFSPHLNFWYWLINIYIRRLTLTSANTFFFFWNKAQQHS